MSVGEGGGHWVREKRVQENVGPPSAGKPYLQTLGAEGEMREDEETHLPSP